MDFGTSSSTGKDATDKSKDIVITAKMSPSAKFEVFIECRMENDNNLALSCYWSFYFII